MHRRRRRCIGDVDVKQIGLRIEPHRRCIGDAERSSDPTYVDPIWEAWTSAPGTRANIGGETATWDSARLH
eukprot:9485488-Pyramimonas_sp.AAC.1